MRIERRAAASLGGGTRRAPKGIGRRGARAFDVLIARFHRTDFTPDCDSA
jgi:hypothetical protein